MDFKILTSLCLMLVPFLTIMCGRNCSKAVRFQIPINIFPQKESYQVLDTIWIETKINKSMLDLNSNEQINVGFSNFQIDVNVLELLDTSWIDGTNNIQIFPHTGSVDIVGFTYPEIVPHLVKYEQDGLQSWKFGLILTQSSKDLVLLFGKRDPRGWHGEFNFPHDNCIYGIGTSTFLTNEGNIDYEKYVIQFPYFKESGNGPNIIENHRNTGAYFIKVN